MRALLLFGLALAACTKDDPACPAVLRIDACPPAPLDPALVGAPCGFSAKCAYAAPTWIGVSIPSGETAKTCACEGGLLARCVPWVPHPVPPCPLPAPTITYRPIDPQ